MAASYIHKLSMLPIFSLIFLSFSQIQSASAAKVLPPPLPESAWVNRTTLNYTTLHNEYAQHFFCMTYPTGVYGFFYYVGVAYSMGLTVVHAWLSDAMRGRFFPMLNFLTSIPVSGYGVWLFYQNIIQFRSCSAYTLNKPIRSLGIASIIATGLFLLGGLILFVMSGFRLRQTGFFTYKLFLLFLLMLAATLQSFIGILSCLVVLSSLNINVLPDGVKLGASVAAFAPLGTFWAVCAILLVWSKWGNISYYNVLQGLIAVVGCSTGATLMIGSTSKVGKIIGDEWGSYAVKDLAGVADLTVLLVVPVLQMLMLYVCSRHGLLQEEVVVVNGEAITETVTINIGGPAAREMQVVHHHVN